MGTRELRAEYNLRKERRNRSLGILIEESIITILAEQEVQKQVAQQQVSKEPPPVATPTNQPEPDPDPSLNASPSEPAQKQYTVDDMIDELNVIRGGRSFTDPEIYGRLVTFFKGLDEEQKSTLDNLLADISELVTSVEEEQVAQASSQSSKSQDQQPRPQPTPAPETPQKKAPMPGAQKAAGAAGVGEV